jgi:putative protease
MVIKGELYKPLELHLAYETHQVCVLGETIMPAENKPLLAEEVKKQLSKLGNTSFTATHIDLMWPEHAFMPISQLNALRREAVLALEKALLESPHELTPLAYEFPTLPSSSEPITYSAKVRTLEQLEACLKEEQLTRIYWEWQYNCPLSEVALALCRKAQKAFYLVLPTIMKDSLWQTYRQALIKWDQRPIAGYLVRTYGQMHHLAHSTKEKILDYTLNVFNQEAINAWVEEGVAAITPSLELSKDELSTLKGPLEKLLYGYYPVMTTDQCLLGHYQQCQKMKKEENFSLKDRKAVTWPLLTDCVGCKMQILSHTPLFTARAPQELMYISRYRLDFTIETSKEVSQVLDTLFARKDQLPFVTQVGSYLKGIQ